MTTFDMKTLKVPLGQLGQLPELVQHKVPVTSKYASTTMSHLKPKNFHQPGPDIAVVSDKIAKVDIFIEERKRRAELELVAAATGVQFDTLRYAYTDTPGSTSQGESLPMFHVLSTLSLLYSVPRFNLPHLSSSFSSNNSNRD